MLMSSSARPLYSFAHKDINFNIIWGNIMELHL